MRDQGQRLSFCSRDPAKAAAFQRRYDGAGAFTSLDAAMRSGDVDSCVICVPHHLHEDLVREAVRHRTHILLEKPIAHSLDSARRIVELCASANPDRTLMIAEQMDHVPVLNTLRNLTTTGRVVSYQFRDHSTFRPSGWRTRRDQVGGGVMLDLGIHWVSLAVAAFGRVASQQRVVGPVVAGTDVPGAERLILRHASGIVGEVDVAWAQPANVANVEVQTAAGRFTYRPWRRFAMLGAVPKFVCLTAATGRRQMIEAYLSRCSGRLAPPDLAEALAVLALVV